MGLRINSNLEALNAHRNLLNTSTVLSKSMEKLSSGLRINRAADDAAGLAISEKMRSQIKGLNQAMRNAQDGISLIQTAEGALNEIHNILQRMRELAVQASSSTLEEADRANIVAEFSQLSEEIDRISEKTTFNNVNLLKGDLTSKIDPDTIGTSLSPENGIANIVCRGMSEGNYRLEVAIASGEATLTLTQVESDLKTVVQDDKGQNIVVTQVVPLLKGFDTETLDFDFEEFGLRGGIQITINANLQGISTIEDEEANNALKVVADNVASIQVGANSGDTISLEIGDMRVNALTPTALAVNAVDSASAAIGQLDAAIGIVSQQRANLGAYQNRLEHTITNLGVASENLSAAESRIRDVDMAFEMMNFTKLQILQQAGTAMLAQANMAPQTVLQLLG